MTRKSCRLVRRLFLNRLEGRSLPATLITVSSLGDSGPGTLRQALADAATEVAPFDGADTIDFAVSGTVTLTSGELVAGKGGIVINGPGASALTVKQTKAGSRVLRIDNGLTVQDTNSISGLTLSGGAGSDTTTAGRGGGIGIATEIVTLTDCVITGNAAAAGAGGIGSTTAAATTLKLVRCAVTDNKATGVGSDGGGIRWTSGQTLELVDCLVSGNTAADDGGGLYVFGTAGLNVSGTSVINNRANGVDGSGGGVSIGSASTGAIAFTNCTIAGNAAQENGGGVRFTGSLTSVGDVAFSYCTISSNTAGASGGGMAREAMTSSGMTVLLDGTVVAANSAAMYPDLFVVSPGTLNVVNAAVGSRDGFVLNSGSFAVAPGTPINLGLPSANGGLTPTVRPAPGSPLIDAGGLPSSPTTDQAGNPRVQGAAADIGSLELVSSAPVANLAAPLATVDKPGGTSYSVALTYFDETAVKFASIGPADLVVTGPAGVTVAVTSVTPGADAPTINVTYTITPPGGAWDIADNGTYTIAVAGGGIEDTGGIPVAGGTVGTLVVAVGSAFTVINDASTGAGSLAAAIAAAQGGTPGLIDLIHFDPAFFSSPRTISIAATTINDSVYVDGPGMELLSIRPSSPGRIFTITDGANSAKNVTLAGLTLRDGAPASGFGGAIRMISEFVTLRGVRMTGNQASDIGGAVGIDTTIGARLTIIDSDFSNNTTIGTSSHGGAIGTGSSPDIVVIIRGSLLAGNTSAGGGGALFVNNASVLVEGSLVTGNKQTSSGSTVGGGAFLLSSPSGAADVLRNVVIRNSTVSGNTAVSTVAGAGGGGAIATNPDFVGLAKLEHATVANNSSGVRGGGITRLGAGGRLLLVNSILDGNSAPTGPDVYGVADSLFSLVGNSSFALVNDLGGTLLNTPALLTPLYNFGGPQRAHATLPGSPAREAGTSGELMTDQRGVGFPRAVGTPDMGAVEFALGTPIATVGALTNVTTPGGSAYQFTVTYHDEAAIDTASINGDEIRVTGPGGFELLASIVGTAGTVTDYVVTYEFTPPGGFWDFFDNGDYTVSLVGGKAFDTGAAAVPATAFGGFNVGLTLNLTVTTNADGGFGSLRQVIADANKQSGPAVVSFDAGFFLTPRTIALTGGDILVANDVTLIGPGPNLVTVSGNKAGRIFDVFNSGKAITFDASGLTFADGKLFEASENGGAIYNNGETVKLTNINLLDNATAGNGGAIYSQGGSVSLTDVTATGSRADGAGGDGGFLFANIAGAIDLVRCTVSGSYAFDGGGAFYVAGTCTLTLDRCTLSGNVADATNTASGGAVYLASAATLAATNTTISGNSAGRNGGGVRFNNGNVTLTSCTVADNTARALVGGGVFRPGGGSGVLTLANTVVADNFAPLAGGTGSDLSCGNVVASDSAVFDGSGWLLTSGSLAVPSFTPLLLGPLTDNGGGFRTHLPAPTSPLRDAGALAGPPTVDQRGVVRPVGGQFDIGAVESDGTEPVGVRGPIADVLSSGGTTYQFTVTYYDDLGINTATLDGSDVLITGVGGFNLFASLAGQTPVPGGVEATYSFNAPGGAWDGADAGTYTAALQAGQVSDLGGMPVAPATLGRFKVQLARNYIVTNINDAGPGSLRQAVFDANDIQGTDGTDTISFNPAVFSTAKTIVLTTGHVPITDSAKIVGPGTRLLTVTTAGASRHFVVYGPNTLSVELTDMTLAGGKLTGGDTAFDAGGSVFVRDEALTVRRVTFAGNSAAVNGGAVFVNTNGANVLFEDCLFAGNSAQNGGALRLSEAGVLAEVRNSTMSGNSAATGGGAISNNGGTLTITNSTLAFNSAGTGSGGGLRHIAGSANLESTIVANNTAPTGPDVSGAVAVTANVSLIGDSTGSNVGGTNLLLNVDPLLAPLADNGGPTNTHALKAGSPALDTGGNSLGLSFDQRGPGFDRAKLAAADIGAFEVQSAAPPTVVSVTINDGLTQRSVVTKLTVNFSEPVSFPSGIAVAFQLTRTGPGFPTGSVDLSPVQAGNAVTLTFLGTGPVGLDKGGSLLDGVYQLTVIAGNVAGAGGFLDGDGNGTGGDNFATPAAGPGRLHRLFGDNDGDADVDAVDFGPFRGTFGSSTNLAFDSDGDGDVDAVDFGQFRLRFGSSV